MHFCKKELYNGSSWPYLIAITWWNQNQNCALNFWDWFWFSYDHTKKKNERRIYISPENVPWYLATFLLRNSRGQTCPVSCCNKSHTLFPGCLLYQHPSTHSKSPDSSRSCSSSAHWSPRIHTRVSLAYQEILYHFPFVKEHVNRGLCFFDVHVEQLGGEGKEVGLSLIVLRKLSWKSDLVHAALANKTFLVYFWKIHRKTLQLTWINFCVDLNSQMRKILPLRMIIISRLNNVRTFLRQRLIFVD